jgi:hypothetical protein
MAKVKGKMTLKQAAELLKTTEHPYSLSALKAAAQGGRLKAQKIDGPLTYYLVSEGDLLAWIADKSAHKSGPKTE